MKSARNRLTKVLAILTVAGIVGPIWAQDAPRRGPFGGPGPGPGPVSGPIPGPIPGPGMWTEHRLSSGHRVFETTQAIPGRGTFRAIRYGVAPTGVVEHPMKSGYLSRTYVQGGHVLYARMYRQNSFQRYGQHYSYNRLVPAIAFSSAYYAWAARPWSAPVSYRWRWDAEPWHRAYGTGFAPYANYSSLDEWLTDYMIAQNLRNAYESWQAENSFVTQHRRPVTGSGAASGPKPYWDTADDGQRPDWETNDDRRPYWDEEPETTSNTSAAQHHAVVDDSPPPLSGQMKAELNAQVKRQLVERQTPAATAAVEDLPDSLKPGHTLFRVNTPLDVPSKTAGQLCSLRANDYIERTGDMDQNGMVPVKVRVGGAADCAIGLVTQVSVNDLEAMEGEQQQALSDALVAASNNMGNGRSLPQAPATKPVYLAAGRAQPMPDAPKTLGQLQ